MVGDTEFGGDVKFGKTPDSHFYDKPSYDSYDSTSYYGSGRPDYEGEFSDKIDVEKLGKSTVNLESVKKMSSATGLPADFVYGLQATESTGNPRAMALNGHLVLSKYSYARAIPKYSDAAGKKAWQEVKKNWRSEGIIADSYYDVHKKSKTGRGSDSEIFQKMYKHSPELAVTNAALGYYQVLGHHILPKYNFNAERLISAFDDDPVEFSHDAFIIWVKKLRLSK